MRVRSNFFFATAFVTRMHLYTYMHINGFSLLLWYFPVRHSFSLSRRPFISHILWFLNLFFSRNNSRFHFSPAKIYEHLSFRRIRSVAEIRTRGKLKTIYHANTAMYYVRNSDLVRISRIRLITSCCLSLHSYCLS